MSLREHRAKPLVVPQCGVIKGGRLNGWRFHFLLHRRLKAREAARDAAP